MACNFVIPFEGDPEPMLTKARFAVESQGGDFTGDIQSGNFNVSVFGNKIAGSYRFEVSTLQIQISEKPFIVPCSAIESFLKNQINK